MSQMKQMGKVRGPDISQRIADANDLGDRARLNGCLVHLRPIHMGLLYGC